MAGEGEGGRKDWTDGGREGGLDRELEGRGRERERINTILQQEKSRSQSVNR